MSDIYSDKNLVKNWRRIARYLKGAADRKEHEMSQKGKNENAIIDQLLKAKADNAAQAQQIADLTAKNATLAAQVEDPEDLAADARAAAILAGNADPGATPAV